MLHCTFYKTLKKPLLQGLFLFLLLLEFSACSHFLYYPSEQLLYPPSRLGLEPEEVWLDSGSGNKLFAWYFRNKAKKTPRAIVVYFHGNGENLSSHYLNLVWLLDHDYDFLIFDYSGYGRSEGDPSPQVTVADGKAALAWTRNKIRTLPGKKTKIIVYGQSLGGAVALRTVAEVQDRKDIALVVADSTFLSYRQMGASILSKHWLTWLFQPLGYAFLSDRYSPRDEITKISPTPLLVVHGNKDEIVNEQFGRELFERALPPKDFWLVEGGEHTDIFRNPKHAKEYQTKFRKYLDERTARP